MVHEWFAGKNIECGIFVALANKFYDHQGVRRPISSYPPKKRSLELCFIPTDKTEEVRRLGMGRMLDEMMRKMASKVEKGGKDPRKILVHSTHDTALAAVCSTLDVFDDRCALPIRPRMSAEQLMSWFVVFLDGPLLRPRSHLSCLVGKKRSPRRHICRTSWARSRHSRLRHGHQSTVSITCRSSRHHTIHI